MTRRATPSASPEFGRDVGDYAPSMASTYSARDVAGEIRRRLPGVPVKKLHKLLYYAQGHHVAVFGLPLFGDSISAWDMGPVVGRLWYDEGQSGPSDDAVELGEAGLNSVGFVLSRYGRLSGNELERLTHSEPPWQEADARRSGVNRSERIDPEVLRAFFMQEPDDEDAMGPPLDPDAVSEWLRSAGRHSADQATEDTAESLLARLP